MSSSNPSSGTIRLVTDLWWSFWLVTGSHSRIPCCLGETAEVQYWESIKIFPGEMAIIQLTPLQLWNRFSQKGLLGAGPEEFIVWLWTPSITMIYDYNQQTPISFPTRLHFHLPSGIKGFRCVLPLFWPSFDFDWRPSESHDNVDEGVQIPPPSPVYHNMIIPAATKRSKCMSSSDNLCWTARVVTAVLFTRSY